MDRILLNNDVEAQTKICDDPGKGSGLRWEEEFILATLEPTGYRKTPMERQFKILW